MRSPRLPTRPSAVPPVGIVGAGRAGLGLALALKRARVRVVGVHGRRAISVPRGLALTVGGPPPWLAAAGVVLLAVRDDAIAAAVSELAASGQVGRGHVVLHLSGALTHEVLAPLAASGAAVGSMHPLMTVSAEPREAARHLRGAVFALEGELRAVGVADALVRRLGGVPVFIAPDAKAVYHAGAVFASNYLVVLLGVAERLLVQAGVEEATARRALARLARATLDNVEEAGAVRALTGPIARGDVATVRRHLGALRSSPASLYRALGEEALALARAAGLDESRARALESVLQGVGRGAAR